MVRIIIIGVIRTIRKGPRVRLPRWKDESVDIVWSFAPLSYVRFVYFSQSWEDRQSVCLTVSTLGHVCLSDMRTLLSAPVCLSVCLSVCVPSMRFARVNVIFGCCGDLANMPHWLSYLNLPYKSLLPLLNRSCCHEFIINGKNAALPASCQLDWLTYGYALKQCMHVYHKHVHAALLVLVCAEHEWSVMSLCCQRITKDCSSL